MIIVSKSKEITQSTVVYQDHSKCKRRWFPKENRTILPVELGKDVVQTKEKVSTRGADGILLFGTFSFFIKQESCRSGMLRYIP